MNTQSHKIHNRNINHQRGMTLVELMVVLSIFVIVTSLSIFDYKSFRSNISIQNLANDITLAVRKAQNFAIGAHNANEVFTLGYGLHFTTSSDSSYGSISGSNKSFIMFIDSTVNKLYDYSTTDLTCGSDNECSEIFNITTSDRIVAIYLNDDTSPIESTSALDITFLRPNPDAIFCHRFNINSSSCNTSTVISHVRIKISNGLTGTDEKTKIISIWNTGQISIE